MDLNKAFGEIMVILSSVVGLALVAVLVSRQANTSGVLGAGGQAFSNIIGAAVSPVTGNAFGSAGGGWTSAGNFGGSLNGFN